VIASNRDSSAARRYRAVKIVHTIVWAFFAGSILGIFACAWAGAHQGAAVFTALVMIEVAVLALNGLRCPLTAVAARYAADPENDIDIYIPRWLAKHNKLVFGTLYVVAILFAASRWKGWL
jgi:hypothetical protein